MPCRSDDWPESRETILNRKMPQVLCGLVTALGPGKVLDYVDWAEAGVTREEFSEWWDIHSAADRERRKCEAEARKREELRKQALAKLTPAEIAALK